MIAPMTAAECRRKLSELEDLRRIVSFGPDKARLGEQCDAVKRECLRLEASEGACPTAVPGGRKAV